MAKYKQNEINHEQLTETKIYIKKRSHDTDSKYKNMSTANIFPRFSNLHIETRKNQEDEFPRRPRRSRRIPATAEHQMAGLRRRDEEGTSAACTSLRGLQLQAEEEDYWKERILLHRENKRQDAAEESRQSQERM